MCLPVGRVSRSPRGRLFPPQGVSCVGAWGARGVPDATWQRRLQHGSREHVSNSRTDYGSQWLCSVSQELALRHVVSIQ